MDAARITNFFVRPALSADLDDLYGLLSEALLTLDGAGYPLAQRRALWLLSLQLIHALIPGGTYYLACVAEELVGCGGWGCALDLYPFHALAGQDAHETALIGAVFVHPAWRRRGIGSQIIKTCELTARRAGARQVILPATAPVVGLASANAYAIDRPARLIGAGGVEVTLTWLHKPLAGLATATVGITQPQRLTIT